MYISASLRTCLGDLFTKSLIPHLPLFGGVEAVIHRTLELLQPLCNAVPNGPERANVTGLNVTQWEGEIPDGITILETH